MEAEPGVEQLFERVGLSRLASFAKLLLQMRLCPLFGPESPDMDGPFGEVLAYQPALLINAQLQLAPKLIRPVPVPVPVCELAVLFLVHGWSEECGQQPLGESGFAQLVPGGEGDGMAAELEAGRPLIPAEPRQRQVKETDPACHP